MKVKLFITAIGFLLIVTTSAFAKTVEMKGEKALSFFNRHSDELNSVDGAPRYTGVFQYTNKKGIKARGYADCWIRLHMGEFWCVVTY